MTDLNRPLALRRPMVTPASRARGPQRKGPLVRVHNGRLVRTDTAVERQPLDTPSLPTEMATAPAHLSLARRLMIIGFIATLFLPSLYNVGSIRLSPSLILLIVTLPVTLGLWAVGRAGQRSVIDALVLAFAIWAAATRFLLLNPRDAIEPAGVVLLQSAGAYFAGRVLVRDAPSMRYTFAVAIIGVILLAPFLVWESVSGTKPLLDLAGRFGQALAPTYMEERWGFSRAQGVFEHPILLGVFCATLVAPAIYITAARRTLAFRSGIASIVAMATLTSLSTGALLSMNVQFALMTWNLLLRRVRRRWIILIALCVAAFVVTDLLSDRTPFHLFVDYATFNTRNSYNRILIWEFGTADVMRSPLIGHGTDEWERPAYMSNSMDNFWLVIAYRYGLVGLALLASVFMLTLFRASKGGTAGDDEAAIRLGYVFAVVATMVAIVSVHLWNNSYIWLMFVLGAGGWLVEAARPRNEAKVRRRQAAPPVAASHFAPLPS